MWVKWGGKWAERVGQCGAKKGQSGANEVKMGPRGKERVKVCLHGLKVKLRWVKIGQKSVQVCKFGKNMVKGGSK